MALFSISSSPQPDARAYTAKHQMQFTLVDGSKYTVVKVYNLTLLCFISLFIKANQCAFDLSAFGVNDNFKN